MDHETAVIVNTVNMSADRTKNVVMAIISYLPKDCYKVTKDRIQFNSGGTILFLSLQRFEDMPRDYAFSGFKSLTVIYDLQ